MKATIKRSLVLAFMFGTLISYANENITTNVNAKKVRIEFKAVKKGANFTIKNKSGFTIYSKEVQLSGDFAKIYDLSALDNGVYNAELIKEFEVITKTFSIKEGLVTFTAENKRAIYKPTIKTKNNTVLISKKSSGNEIVKISLYYKNELIYLNTFKGEENLNKVFRLLENKKGAYKVVINGNNKYYTKEFTL